MSFSTSAVESSAVRVIVAVGLLSVTSVVESSAVRLVIVESSITNSTSVRRLSNVSEIEISLVSLIELIISSFWFDLLWYNYNLILTITINMNDSQAYLQ